jgi:hypothetical protein
MLNNGFQNHAETTENTNLYRQILYSLYRDMAVLFQPLTKSNQSLTESNLTLLAKRLAEVCQCQSVPRRPTEAGLW